MCTLEHPAWIMDGNDNRQIARDSLFLLADLRVEGVEGEHKIKVRNLSAGGMMGEGSVSVVRGTVLSVNLRNIGWVDGTVAWVQGNRFGVAFATEIDARLARVPLVEGTQSPRYTRPPLLGPQAPGVLRKV